MTVLAWDGKSLCADRRASSSGLIFSVTKIFKIDAGLIGIDGTMDVGMRLIDWVKKGCKAEDFPDCQKDNDRYCFAMLITPEKEIIRYERQPFPLKIEEPFFATGSGRDFAMAAMSLGKTSREAVELACRYEDGCGNGIDELSL